MFVQDTLTARTVTGRSRSMIGSPASIQQSLIPHFCGLPHLQVYPTSSGDPASNKEYEPGPPASRRHRATASSSPSTSETFAKAADPYLRSAPFFALCFAMTEGIDENRFDWAAVMFAVCLFIPLQVGRSQPYRDSSRLCRSRESSFVAIQGVVRSGGDHLSGDQLPCARSIILPSISQFINGLGVQSSCLHQLLHIDKLIFLVSPLQMA